MVTRFVKDIEACFSSKSTMKPDHLRALCLVYSLYNYMNLRKNIIPILKKNFFALITSNLLK